MKLHIYINTFGKTGEKAITQMSKHSKNKHFCLYLFLYVFTLDTVPFTIPKLIWGSKGKMLQLFKPVHEAMQISVCTS